MKTSNESYQNSNSYTNNQIHDTQNQINNLQTQIDKVVRSRKRNILFFDYSSFLYRTIEKITSKKHFENIDKRTEQNTTLSALHNSLIGEQLKLINKRALMAS